ncbi:MAG: Gfo/Idh/MocA family oxidoreductase [Magnetococcales bacterium]|nr:Gfo/Idh/MocA family oxidoreductase [Magnetococcales bacterium]
MRSNGERMPQGCAIVGTGGAARSHAAHLKALPHVKLHAIWGSDPQRTAQIAQTLDCHAATDFHQLLNHADISAIIFANEPGRHVLAAQAARAGRHVLVEKPLAATLHDGEEIVAACRENNIVAATVFQRRFGTEVAQIKELLNQETIGRIRRVETRTLIHRDPSYYRQGNRWRLEPCGGLVMNFLSHQLDLVIHFFGPVRRVFACLDFLEPGSRIDREAMIILELCYGLRVTIWAAANFPKPFGESWTIIGEEGSIRMYGNTLQISDKPWGNDMPVGMRHHLRHWFFSRRSPPPPVSGTLKDQHADFFAAIEEGRDPKVTIEDGWNVLKLTWAIHESHDRKTWVELL